MVNKSGRIGTKAEVQVASYMAKDGWPGAERRKTEGKNDRGDINSGRPELVVEVKADRGLQFPAFLRETEKERVNAGANVGVCVIKPPGVAEKRMHLWWMLMSGGTYDALELVANARASVLGGPGFMAWWYEGQHESNRRGFKTAAWFKSAETRVAMVPGTRLKPGLKRISSTGWDMRFLYLPDGLELLRVAGYGGERDAQ